MPLIDRQFADLVDVFAHEPGVSTPDEPGRRGFGALSLKVNGAIFATLSQGRLVVKLPGGRVAALIDARTGEAFDAGKGRPMKEWVIVTDEDPATWLTFAREALSFVGSRSRR